MEPGLATLASPLAPLTSSLQHPRRLTSRPTEFLTTASAWRRRLTSCLAELLAGAPAPLTSYPSVPIVAELVVPTYFSSCASSLVIFSVGILKDPVLPFAGVPQLAAMA